MWTEERVRQVIPDALRVLAATEGKVGPRRVLTNWPDMALEWHELVNASEVDSGYRMKVPRRAPSAVDIEHADMVLLGFKLHGTNVPGFLNGPLILYPTQRQSLIIASSAKARRQSERSVCRTTGWNLSTFQRQRSFAAQVIADWLNKIGLPAW